MSAQVPSPALGTFEPPARLIDWLRAVDPVVRGLSLLGMAGGAALVRTNPVAGMLLVSAALAFLGWSKPDAIDRHIEQTAVDATLRELDQRMAEGQLDPDAYAVRRAWVLETAKL